MPKPTDCTGIFIGISVQIEFSGVKHGSLTELYGMIICMSLTGANTGLRFIYR